MGFLVLGVEGVDLISGVLSSVVVKEAMDHVALLQKSDHPWDYRRVF